MPTFDSYEPGWPCWVDLMSPDVAASEGFYGAVFGWSADAQFDDDGNRIYANFTLDGRNVCGLGGQAPGMEGAPPIWNTYVCTDDIEATVTNAEAAGGSVMMPPMQVMEHGHMAILADPTGAAISVWQPGAHRGAQVANDAGTWSWNELLTRDLAAAKPFYAEVFGWEYDDQDMPNGTYTVILGGENNGLGGMMAMPDGMPDMVPNHWMVYFSTDDIDATIERVTSNGGQVAQPPFAIPGVGTIAVIHDPQGGSFSLMQPESRG